jgi:alkylhydroperoxidase/carboxymuconolactone decarboxylase family protein YurZ
MKKNGETIALDKVREWDLKWADIYTSMSTNPWTNGILPVKEIELICVALEAACTNLNPDGTRHHIRAALRAGATRNEILEVLKMAALLAIHSCSLDAPILLEEAKAAGVKPTRSPTPVPTRLATKRVRSVNGTPLGIPSSNLIPAGPISSWPRVSRFTSAPYWRPNWWNS